jgi:hypothetical protein
MSTDRGIGLVIKRACRQVRLVGQVAPIGAVADQRFVALLQLGTQRGQHCFAGLGGPFGLSQVAAGDVMAAIDRDFLSPQVGVGSPFPRDHQWHARCWGGHDHLAHLLCAALAHSEAVIQAPLVNVGVDADTVAFAVESIRRWWQKLGHARYPDASNLIITSDRGGSNGSKVIIMTAGVLLEIVAGETEFTTSVYVLDPFGADFRCVRAYSSIFWSKRLAVFLPEDTTRLGRRRVAPGSRSWRNCSLPKLGQFDHDDS